MNDLLEDIVDQRTQHGSIFISSYSSSLFLLSFSSLSSIYFFASFFAAKFQKMNIERGVVLEMGLFFANQDLQDNIIMDRAKQQYQSSLVFQHHKEMLEIAAVFVVVVLQRVTQVVVVAVSNETIFNMKELCFLNVLQLSLYLIYRENNTISSTSACKLWIGPHA